MESILTALVAFLLFKEAIGRRVWGVALMMLTGSLILSYEPSKSAILLSKGSLLVLGASFMWALDNNLTRSLSLKDPLSIAAIKGLAAGIVSACAAWYAGEKFPPAGGIAVTMTVGFFCYGASLVLFVYALRHLGTARTGAYFSLGPFIGAVASVILLKEPVTCQLAAAALVMGLGTCLLVREEHSHEHTHEPMWHDHRHSHNDGHHNHTHPEVPGNVEDHCHPHEHELLVHSHHHMPELHHRHSH
jgi:drug/metabolite transporter (DMT)-like permease